MKGIIHSQDKIFQALANKADNYCLGGGTALSKVYFRHRESLDLDFFTTKFSRKDILNLMKLVSENLKINFKLTREQQERDKIRIMVFTVPLSKKEVIKIDFIEDYIKRLRSAKRVDGIWVFSLEDIYLRKIYAISGTIEIVDLVGRKINKGGREEAKDFYDLYFLSHTFMNLSDFAFKYCDAAMQESLIRWLRSYSRLDIQAGLLELRIKKRIDYKDMERHFKKEIDYLLEKQIGEML
jgi:predicted nucleotidyltransferase component of viral defense system